MSMQMTPVSYVGIGMALLKGIHNGTITDLCLEWRHKKISEDPNATGNEDSRIPDHKAVDQLKEKITNIFHSTIDDRYYLSEIWAHILEDKETTMIHSHRNPQDYNHLNLSWVYYPKVPIDMKGGTIIFQMQQHNQTKNHSVSPEEGLLIVFPSWLPHYTTRNETGGLRVSISGNMKIKNEDYPHVSRDRSSGIHTFYGVK